MKNYTNFKLDLYTEIVFGKGTEREAARLVKKHGGTKVMLVYGSGSIKKSGLYDTVVRQLNDAGIAFVEFSGVEPNPRRSYAQKGLEMARAEGVDFLLGLGGGSSIDTAKAIALGLANGGGFWPFFTGTAPEKMAPVGTIHTIAAAGSETSRSAVLVDDIGKRRKYGFMYDPCRPVFAIMNPELTYTVSPYQTGAGAADILAHTVNRYFAPSRSYLGDQYAAGTMRTVVKYGPIAVRDPQNYEARAELMLAGSFSHNDITGIGRDGMHSGSEHALEEQLSGVYDTAHGAGLSVVMPAWLQYLADYGAPMHVARVAQFALDVFGADADLSDIKAIADDGLDRFRSWLKSIGMPVTLKELGVPKEDLQAVIDRACPQGHVVGGFMQLDRDAVARIFTSCVE
ncbi:MAG: iron-containing alcohol dehydrogenase [Christensenellales bacterium]